MTMEERVKAAAGQLCKEYVCANDVLPIGQGCKECGASERIASIILRHMRGEEREGE